MQAKNEKTAIMRLIERMRADKKFEAGVYITLLTLIILFYLVLGGIKVQNPATDGNGEELEEQLERTLAHMQGVGDTHVIIHYAPDGSGAIGGVLVIAQGADDILTRASIQSAVHTLLGVEADKVGVYRMNENVEEE